MELECSRLPRNVGDWEPLSSPRNTDFPKCYTEWRLYYPGAASMQQGWLFLLRPHRHCLSHCSKSLMKQRLWLQDSPLPCRLEPGISASLPPRSYEQFCDSQSQGDTYRHAEAPYQFPEGCQPEHRCQGRRKQKSCKISCIFHPKPSSGKWGRHL